MIELKMEELAIVSGGKQDEQKYGTDIYGNDSVDALLAQNPFEKAMAAAKAAAEKAKRERAPKPKQPKK